MIQHLLQVSPRTVFHHQFLNLKGNENKTKKKGKALGDWRTLKPCVQKLQCQGLSVFSTRKQNYVKAATNKRDCQILCFHPPSHYRNKIMHGENGKVFSKLIQWRLWLCFLEPLCAASLHPHLPRQCPGIGMLQIPSFFVSSPAKG